MMCFGDSSSSSVRLVSVSDLVQTSAITEKLGKPWE
jgi:hypothetical protein